MRKLVLALGCSFIVLGYLSINMGLPAFPLLADYFDTKIANLHLTTSLFLITYALGQIVWGLLSERYGRRPIALCGVSLAFIGAMVSALAFSLPMFMMGRVLEGFGAAFAPTLARALAADVFEGKRLKTAFASLITIAAILPAIAPIIGGNLMASFGWRSIFLVMAGVSLSLLVIQFFGQIETNQHIVKDASVKELSRGIFALLKHRTFLGYLIPYVLTTSGLISFYTLSPYIFITALDYSPQFYGYALLVIGLAYVLGAWIMRLLIERFDNNTILLTGFSLGVVAVVVLLLFTVFAELSVWSVCISMVIYAVSCGIISPVANSAAISSTKVYKGTAAALFGALVMASSSVCNALFAKVNLAHLQPLCFMIGGIVVMSICFFCVLIHPSFRGQPGTRVGTMT
ncbi:MAG: Bcr/CflA family efflux MFS transporter [Verrucomicrobiota bacterium]